MPRWCWLLLMALPFAADPPPEPDADEQLLQKAGTATDGPALTEFFRQRTLAEPERLAVAALVRQLGSDSFPERQKASLRLKESGLKAVPLLRRALHDDDPEVARRAEDLLAGLPRSGAELTRAAARVLARRKSAGAVPVLVAFLPFAEDDSAEEDLSAALLALS